MGCKSDINLFLFFLLIGCCTVFAQLPICNQYQACGTRLRSYPLLEETVGQMVEELGSGVSSGEEAEIPMQYDEFVTAKTIFDFDAEPVVNEKRLCRCKQEDEDVCDYEQPSNLIDLDPKRLTLVFCQPISNVTRLRCLGRNQFLVMGHIGEDGQTLTEVNDVAAYCLCPNGVYQQRPQIEPWLNEYVFSYRCGK